MPISAQPPIELTALFEAELGEVAKLLKQPTRPRVDVDARLRPLAIVDATIRGEKSQPSTSELRKMEKRITTKKKWRDLFPGVSSIEISPTGEGPMLSLRLTKKEGIPVAPVPLGTPGASVVAVKRVDELGFYNLGARELAKQVGVSVNQWVAVVRHLKLDKNADCFKELTIGKSKFKRYSQKAIPVIKSALAETPIAEIWAKHRPRKATT